MRRAHEGRGPKANGLGTVLDFLQAIWALDHGLQTTSKRMEVSIGLTGPQRLVVRVIARRPGITAGQLSTLLHVHPSTLTGVLRRLERRAILRRVTDSQDARRAFLYLTRKGRARDARRSGTVEAAVRRALSRVPVAQVAATRQVLLAIAEELMHDSRRPREPR